MEQTVDTYLSYCKFCGQTLETGQVAFTSQEDADEFATTHCDCQMAKDYRSGGTADGRKLEDLLHAREILDELFTDRPDGPAPDVSEKVVDTIYAMVVAVYDDKLINFAVQVDDSTKLKVCKTARGALRITKTASTVQNREV